MELNWHSRWTIDHWSNYRIKWRLSELTDGPFSKNILVPIMRERGIIPSQNEITKRGQILKEIEMIVIKWIEAIGARRGIDNLSAAVVPYGSYGLEVYNGSSDVDILVIAPACASMEPDFLVHLRDLVETIPDVAKLRSIGKAKVPLLKFNMRGVNVDLACARLNTIIVPRPEILPSQNFCIPLAIDVQSRLTLESVKSNWTIFQCVEENKEATLFLKSWADRRGIYGNINCYIGGVHLVVMVAYICKRYRVKSFAGVVSYFFARFSRWVWDCPVVLHGDIGRPSGSIHMPIHMPIQKPGTNTLCSSNVTPITLTRICNELERGYILTQVLSSDWRALLDQFPYETVYNRFIKVHMSVIDTDAEVDEWMSFVKSRLSVLVRSLEAKGIGCDPSVVEFRDLPPRRSTINKDDNRVFMWGILNDTGERYDLTGPEASWKHNLTINNGSLRGQVKLAVVPRGVYAKYRCRNMVNRT